MIPYYYLNRQKTKTEEFIMEQKAAVIFTQIMERPARKLILFRSKNAADYFEYCEEVGCGTPEKPAPWDILCGIKDALNEPTHMHKLGYDAEELTREIGGTGAASLVMQTEEGKRSFKVALAKPEGSSYAKDIAKKYGVTYDMLVGGSGS